MTIWIFKSGDFSLAHLVNCLRNKETFLNAFRLTLIRVYGPFGLVKMEDIFRQALTARKEDGKRSHLSSWNRFCSMNCRASKERCSFPFGRNFLVITINLRTKPLLLSSLDITSRIQPLLRNDKSILWCHEQSACSENTFDQSPSSIALLNSVFRVGCLFLEIYRWPSASFPIRPCLELRWDEQRSSAS